MVRRTRGWSAAWRPLSEDFCVDSRGLCASSAAILKESVPDMLKNIGQALKYAYASWCWMFALFLPVDGGELHQSNCGVENRARRSAWVRLTLVTWRNLCHCFHSLRFPSFVLLSLSFKEGTYPFGHTNFHVIYNMQGQYASAINILSRFVLYAMCSSTLHTLSLIAFFRISLEKDVYIL